MSPILIYIIFIALIQILFALWIWSMYLDSLRPKPIEISTCRPIICERCDDG